MKKIITILMLAVAVMMGGMTVEAKTTAKKKSSSSSSSSIKFSQLYDGYPNVGGHTYTATMDGIKFTVRFGPYSPSNGIVYLKATYKGQWEEEVNNWYYEGDGVIMFYMNGGTPNYYEIRNGGRELYNAEMGLTLKAIK